MNKKLNWLLLPLSLALLLPAGCGKKNTETPEETAPATTEDTMDGETVLDQGYAGYESLVQLIGQNIEEGWTQMDAATLSLPDWLEDESCSFGYQITDLDGDEVNELLIALFPEGEEAAKILVLYTLDAETGERETLFCSNGTSYLELTEDGTFVLTVPETVNEEEQLIQEAEQESAAQEASDASEEHELVTIAEEEPDPDAPTFNPETDVILEDKSEDADEDEGTAAAVDEATDDWDEEDYEKQEEEARAAAEAAGTLKEEASVYVDGVEMTESEYEASAEAEQEESTDESVVTSAEEDSAYRLAEGSWSAAEMPAEMTPMTLNLTLLGAE